MFARAPLLPRLRRHPLLWVLVAVVLLTKLVSSSVCAADVRAVDATPTQATSVAASPFTNGAGGCLLGEAACHCACAETLPIPALPFASVADAAPAFIAPHRAITFVPLPLDSALRPPIA